jgi:transcriptional regulator with XRE-family HTH domain
MSKRVILPDAVKAIREARAAGDDSYRLGQFATRCLMSSAHLCNIEAGRKAATEEVIHRIAAHLGVPISAISYERPLEAAS